MLVIKGFIAYAIPDVPHWVAVEMAKIEFRRREIEKDSSNTLLLAASASSANTTNASNTAAQNSRNNSINLTVGNSLDTEDRAIQTEVAAALTPVAVTPKNTPVKEASPPICQLVTDSPASASLSASEGTELSSRYQRPRPMRSAMHASSLTTATY